MPRTHTKKVPADHQTILIGSIAGIAVCLLVTIGSTMSTRFSASSVNVNLTVIDYDDDIHPPYLDGQDPASGALLVPVGTDVSFHLKDYKNNDGVHAGSGVDLSSVRVTITIGTSSTTYQNGNAEFSATGVAANRTITIDPAADFPFGTLILVSVDAQDLHTPANVMSTVMYSFRTVPAASSSSSSVATQATSSAPAREDAGAHRGQLDQIIQDSLSPEHYLQIVERRKLPNNSVIERVLPRSETQSIDQCYIDNGDASSSALTFTDVPGGAWYAEALRWFVRQGVIDGAQPLFRPASAATRAEMAKMLTLIAQVPTPAATKSSFADVAADAWYAAYIQAAAKNGWMRGDRDCYGAASCTVRPAATLTRAEAAAMIVRFHGQVPLNLSPRFPDVPANAWYAAPIGAAADRCVIAGTPAGLAEPARLVTRSELIVMLYRSIGEMRYGRDCGRF